MNLNSIADFETYIEDRVSEWSPEQRTALAAGMAERWIAVYDAFTRAEDWGDAEAMHSALDAAWGHISGKRLAAAEIGRLAAQVEDITPHMDFTDDLGAITAAVMVEMALRSCREGSNAIPAMQAVISGFEAVAPDWDMDPDEQPRLWGRSRVQREFKAQVKLVELIEAIGGFDGAAVESLRKQLRGKTFAGRAAPGPGESSGRVVVTNQWAFEQYRGMVEVDNRDPRDWWHDEGMEPGSFGGAMMVIAAWSARYSRRRYAIENPLVDAPGKEALVARHMFVDSADLSIPDWGDDMNMLIEMSIRNLPHTYDVTGFDQPHHYGPSLRTLWHKATAQGYPPEEVWRYIVDWGRHRPAAWAAEDARKRAGKGYAQPELGPRLARAVRWRQTDDRLHPWAAQVDEEAWQVRINDYPDDYMYSLLVTGSVVGDFHDWPGKWGRI